jgi:hypothetical protein
MAFPDLFSGIDEPTRRFLASLHEETAGDLSLQVSMYDIGEKIGMDRSEATRAAENVLAEGWAEVRTLSGKIGMTQEGIDACQAVSGGAKGREDTIRPLGPGVSLDPEVRQGVEQVAAELKLKVQTAGLTFDALAELVADLRTIDVQLSSPRAKTAIIRACLRSVLEQMTTNGLTEDLASLKRLLD